MSLAREINKKLDEIIVLKNSIEEFKKEIESGALVQNVETGEEVSKEKALNKAQEIMNQIQSDLNKITNNGENIRDIFTNEYYVNNMMLDKEIREDDNLITKNNL